MMIRFQELKTMPEAQRLMKLALLVLCIWVFGLILLSNALFLKSSAQRRLVEADGVINAASAIKAYPSRSVTLGQEPLSAISSVLDSLKLRDRVSQMSSSATGLVLQVNDLYVGEMSGLIEAISNSGLTIRTAEIRAISTNQSGRKMTISFVLEGEAQ